jgi:peroxiredoxin
MFILSSKARLGCVLMAMLSGGVAQAANPAPAAGPAYRLEGQMAPDFALRSWGGPNLRLSEHRGEVVALTFFGSHCGQCGAQIAGLARVLDTYQSAGLAVLAVNVDDDPQAANQFIAGHRTAVPMLLDPDKTVARIYRVDVLPLLLIIDRAGRIRYAQRDFRPGQDAQSLNRIKTLLDE